MSGRTSLAGLIGAVLLMAVWVEVRTPAALLTPPRRPDEVPGNPGVRFESAAYPRYATGTDDVRVRIDRPPRRIISQFWSTDEFLYAIVPPERVVGVSETAGSTASSNVLPFVERYRPVVATEPEHVLRADPDLVLTPDSESSNVPGLLRDAGLPVYRIYTRFETLQSIEDHIRLIGYLTGEDERAAVAAEAFHAAIRLAAARRPAGQAPPRVLGLGGVYTNGAQTLFSDILRVLGAENVAATQGLVGYGKVTDEHIVRWDPDWIVAGADRGKVEAVRAQLLANPAVAATAAARHGRVVVISNEIFLPMSPYAVRLVETLADVFYGPAVRP